jgi:predicted NAD/FAD-binding protein
MLELGNFPQWLTISGGSRTYVEAFKKAFPGVIHLNAKVKKVSRSEKGCQVFLGDTAETFDDLVLATHADQSLKLLSDPSHAELEALSPWIYSRNSTILHSDEAAVKLPRRYWASWNVIDSGDTESGVHVHYHMNQLQSLTSKQQFFVSLNATLAPTSSKVHYSTLYEHPIFSTESVATQSKFQELNGQKNTYFCGAYQRYGFHEDGVLSAVNVAKRFGIEW